MVERVQGAGSRVVRDAPAGVFIQSYRSVSELTRYAEDTQVELLTISEIELSAEVARRIGGNTGEIWCFFRALRRVEADGEPIAVIESYLPARFAEIARGMETIEGPLYDALSAAAAEPIEQAEQEMQALPAPYHVADALGIAPGAPTLRILRRYMAASGTLIASFNWHHGGDRFIHRASLSLGGG